ncbi:glutamate-gated chloride channel isoform X2 [Venturia canescens]|uniref:glutamate-gated chloride channel isoform X2 n=1 Tax=Venturia canescens TaxID=32260 RepID=UPI001C9D0807|nr:glutamate-gated chloride channel isoform X2 [Venturia canescens]
MHLYFQAAAMWPGVLPLVALLTVLLHSSRCTQGKVNFREKEKKVLDEILGPQSYDARIRPSGENGTDGPAYVHVNIFVRSISKIDDVTMEYSVQLTFREQWLDERLKFNDFGGRLKYLTLTESNRVWMPDLFFSNEKEGHFHNIIMPNVYIRIFPNGSVLYSIRISLTLSCPMNLKLYPLDRQTCSLRMASYGWTTDDLVFVWKEGDPVQIVKNLHLPRFTLEKFLTDYCNSKTNTGEYSCLKVDLLFKREFSYYLIQIYIPCCMLVIVSWVSFWLDQSAVPARVSLGVTTLLTMATQTSGINASLPPVSYTKAIDVWTGVCLTFVFGALLEFALVNYASRSDMHRENMKKKYREMEHSSSVDPATELLQADSGTNFAMVVAVQVPDEVQAHRRHITDHLPPRVRAVQPRVLVHVPVPGGGGQGVIGGGSEETTPGSREVARGHLYHTHTRHRTRHHHSSSRNGGAAAGGPNHHQHHHHHHHHHHEHHHHQHQHHNHQASRSTRQHHPEDSPTSWLQSDNETQSSPITSQTLRLSGRTSASPASSRMVTPSPPILSQRNSQDFSRLPNPKSDKYWGIVSRDLFKCHAKGSARIDVIARFAFPLSFVFFNLAYWSMYLFREEDTAKMKMN